MRSGLPWGAVAADRQASDQEDVLKSRSNGTSTADPMRNSCSLSLPRCASSLCSAPGLARPTGGQASVKQGGRRSGGRAERSGRATWADACPDNLTDPAPIAAPRIGPWKRHSAVDGPTPGAAPQNLQVPRPESGARQPAAKGKPPTDRPRPRSGTRQLTDSALETAACNRCK